MNETPPRDQAAMSALGRLLEQYGIQSGAGPLPPHMQTPEGYAELGRQSLAVAEEEDPENQAS